MLASYPLEVARLVQSYQIIWNLLNKPSQNAVIETTIEECLTRQFRIYIIEDQDQLDSRLRRNFLLPG